MSKYYLFYRSFIIFSMGFASGAFINQIIFGDTGKLVAAISLVLLTVSFIIFMTGRHEDFDGRITKILTQAIQEAKVK
jgi:hypothetical protein